MINICKKTVLELVLGAGLGLIILYYQVSAQPLTMDTPSGNLTGEIDISIDPPEPLPANGTSTISTRVQRLQTSTDFRRKEFTSLYLVIPLQ